jgi:hypothetical protein
LQKIDDHIALIRRQPVSFHRHITGSNNSKTDCLAVKKFTVIAGTLDRMTHRVSKIEKRSLTPAITLVFHHDLRLDFDVAADERCKVFKIDIFQGVEHFRVGNDGVLDDFGEALVELPLRQRFQDIQIVDHDQRMMNCADQIFPGGCIDTGLSAD